MCMNQQVKKFIFLLRQGTMHPTTYILSIYQRLVHCFLSFAIGIPETMHPTTYILSIYQRLVHFFLSFAIGIPETMHPSTCIWARQPCLPRTCGCSCSSGIPYTQTLLLVSTKRCADDVYAQMFSFFSVLVSTKPCTDDVHAQMFLFPQCWKAPNVGKHQTLMLQHCQPKPFPLYFYTVIWTGGTRLWHGTFWYLFPLQNTCYSTVNLNAFLFFHKQAAQGPPERHCKPQLGLTSSLGASRVVAIPPLSGLCVINSLSVAERKAS